MLRKSAVVLLVAVLAWGGLLGWRLSTLSLPPVVLVAVFVLLFLELAIPAWVYYDATKRGLDNPGEWLAIAIVPAINVFGLAAYLAGRDIATADE